MSADRPQVGSDYTVSNRQCLGPHTVKQAFLHRLLQCPNMDQFSNCWELVHWHFRSRMVMHTILVALDPHPHPSTSARKSVDPGPRISASAHLWCVRARFQNLTKCSLDHKRKLRIHVRFKKAYSTTRNSLYLASSTALNNYLNCEASHKTLCSTTREADTIPTDSVPTDAIPTICSQDDPVHL